ncbi:hypothetical protein JW905_17460 [bacterium]|nr:hypothetical protein [candidate division CSSED10-310 bacterium]
MKGNGKALIPLLLVEFTALSAMAGTISLGAGIASAFNRLDADSMLVYLEPQGKVFMEAPVFGIGRGRYSPGQCAEQLRQVFTGKTTISFRYRGGTTSNHCRADWTVQDIPTGKLLSFAVYFEMTERDGATFLRAIRITRSTEPLRAR